MGPRFHRSLARGRRGGDRRGNDQADARARNDAPPPGNRSAHVEESHSRKLRPRHHVSAIATIGRRALTTIVAALAALTALTGICSIWIWQLRWPAADLWRQYVPLLGLRFPDNLLVLESGHRPLLPNLVRVFDVWCCGADQSATTAVAFVLAVASVAILLRATIGDDRLGCVQRATVAFFVALA